MAKDKHSIVRKELVAWYNAEDWNELKALCVDLHATHAEWLAAATRGIAAAGLRMEEVEKVVLTPAVLRTWQSQNPGWKITSTVRASLAAEIGAQRDDTTH